MQIEMMLAALLFHCHALVVNAQVEVAPDLVIRFGGALNTSAGLSSDGTIVAAGTNGYAMLFDASTGDSLYRFFEFPSNPVFSVEWAGQSRKLATTTLERTSIWDSDTRQEIARPGADSVRHQYATVWSSDDRFVATGDFDSTVRVWSATTGELIDRMTFPTSIVDLQFIDNDERLFLTLTNGYFHIWNLQTGEVDLSVLVDPDAAGYWPVVGAVNEQGTLIATSSNSALQTGDIVLWSPESGDSVGVLKGHSTVAVDLEFGQDGVHLASAAYDKTARLWDVDQRTSVALFRDHSGYISDMDLNTTSRRLVTVGGDSTIRIWSYAVSSRPENPVAGEAGLRLRSIHPNPAMSRVTLTIAHGTTHPVSVSLINSLGRSVLHLSGITSENSESKIELNVESIPVGTYLCLISAGRERYVEALQIIR